LADVRGAKKLILQKTYMSKLNNYLNLAWRHVNWALVQKRVRRVQRRIYKASSVGNIRLVHRLQYTLIVSLDAKLLAVRAVTTLNKGKVTTLNKGKVTAGVDGVAVVGSILRFKFSSKKPPSITSKEKRKLKLDKNKTSPSIALLRKAGDGGPSIALLRKAGDGGPSIASLRKAGDGGPGIVSDKYKVNLAKTLRLDGKASPIRRVWVPKPGKIEKRPQPGKIEKRPLGIPTLKDRAKQALAKYALEPEWEARFEPNSYLHRRPCEARRWRGGFRPGRRTHDAIEAIFLSLHHLTPKWVYDADISKCFDRIDHKALLTKLNTFPMMKEQVAAWLRADIMEGYANAPKNVISPSMGTPQGASIAGLAKQGDGGGVISPLLANIALHGLELHLKEYVAKLNIKPTPSANRGRTAKQKALSVIRYADDFVLIHVNKEIIDLCIIETTKWLANVGLEISQQKSALKLGTQGFKFLGFQIIQVVKSGKYKVKITPAKAKALALLAKIREIIQNNKSASSYQLISILRPIIIGWALLCPFPAYQRALEDPKYTSAEHLNQHR
jgi:group II intron reverse transcriptase/maturase